MLYPEPEPGPSRGSVVAIAVGACVVVLLVAGAYFLGRGSGVSAPGAAPSERLPFGPEEQAYASQLRFSDIELSRAVNMANQEFTYVVGKVENGGPRNVRNLEVSVEFHDLIGQNVRRETVRMFPAGVPALRAGERREFQFTFEAVPASWNRQAPSFRITGIALE